jgi:CDP-diacylglycerol--glycerol-3-phosphate 3-phosphatidyltransferase
MPESNRVVLLISDSKGDKSYIKMTQLPNVITLLRIAGSLGLLLCDVTGVVYWIIYALCGISDITDGWLARKLKCVTKKGALLDSVADICFVACCAWKLLPILELPQWLWLWAGVIVAIKIVDQLSALVRYGRCYFPHTTANKATGFLLFIAVPMIIWSIVPIVIVASVATFAAVQEGHFIRTRNNMRKIVTLVFTLVAASCWAQTSISDNTSYGACIMRDGSVSGINENKRFAMHSVMKFPQALYVADYLSRKGLALVPDGSHTIIAVFTKQSPSETVIADIARQLLEQ